MASEILLETETLCVEYFFENDPNRLGIAFTFSARGNKTLVGNMSGGNLLFKNQYDVISFKISNDDWFQQVPIELFDQVKKVTQQKQYAQRVAYATSMGSYGIMAFSKLLDLDIAVLFGPRSCISLTNDAHWKSLMETSHLKYKVNSESISIKCLFIAIYDNKCRDKLHVDHLANIVSSNKLLKYIIPYASHKIYPYLKETRLLQIVLIKAFKEKNLSGINFKRNKNLSNTYLKNLAQRLMKKKKYAWALSIINEALKLKPDDEQSLEAKNKLLALLN